ncbi:hypothetical protein [Actinomadura sp. KC216]|uniref:hypothetical protein n=1 Tax=Actinomadura sp. KC216 TaxID=2530370 RepID=UPI001404DEEB|nr:hypothetical protein [Actinomadura sp. KC216]
MRAAGRPLGTTLSLVNRVCGVAVLLFLLLHIAETSLVLFSPRLYDATMDAFRTPPMVVAEFLLIAAVVYHLLWGLLVMAIEVAPRTARRRTSVWWGLGVGYAAALAAIAWIMLVPLL